MKRHFVSRLRTGFVAMVCLAMATPVWAGTERQTLDVFLQGVNSHGCLTDCGGTCAPFCAVINTCTGKFCGTARGCVRNESCRSQCYRNVNFFTDCSVRVKCSQYKVDRRGKACYTASGCIEQQTESIPPA